jgi:uncharacterized phiE125 gp8 family phage protein
MGLDRSESARAGLAVEASAVSEFYELSATGGASVLSLVEAKAHMRVTAATEDTRIAQYIAAATRWCEQFTGWDLRENTWALWLDEFTNPITLRKHPVASITSIKHNVSASPVTISSDDYVLKHLHLCAEIWRAPDTTWPSNTDEGQHQIEIIFVTETPPADIAERAEVGLMQHVAYMYENRGDQFGTVGTAAYESGAVQNYTFGAPKV